MRVKRATPEEIAEELAKRFERPLVINGHEFKGDIFYDNLWIIAKNHAPKKQAGAFFHRLCQLLTERGFYIHS